MLLNIDLGELPDEDEALYVAADLANIACGGHTGDTASMGHAVALCLRHATQIGAHPSFPDREGFGRRVVELSLTELRESFAQQLAGLQAVCTERGARIVHLKPHGALYHAAHGKESLAEALLGTAYQVLSHPVAVVGPVGGGLHAAAARRGWEFLPEGFADRGRRQTDAGRWELVPRGDVGAVLTSVDAVLAMLDRHAREREIATVCLHGDNPEAATLASRIRRALDHMARSRDFPTT